MNNLSERDLVVAVCRITKKARIVIDPPMNTVDIHVPSKHVKAVQELRHSMSYTTRLVVFPMPWFYRLITWNVKVQNIRFL